MGRRSSSIVLGGFDFGIGTTFDRFQTSGNIPSPMDALKIAVIGLLMYGARSWRIQLGIPSGPGDLDTHVDISLRSTCSTSHAIGATSD